MVTGCVIRKCSSVWSPISYTSFHCFPLRNQEMISKWMKAIPPGFITIPKESSRICSCHFIDSCFTYSQRGKRTLKKDAVPTLFGSEARKEDILKPSKIMKVEHNDSDDSFEEEEQKLYRYVKKSKYLQAERPVLKQEKPIVNRATKSQLVNTTILIQKTRNPKISSGEIELKKQIIMLKKRLLRRETRNKSMMKVNNSFKAVVITENVN